LPDTSIVVASRGGWRQAGCGPEVSGHDCVG
jgi:hypothetical protein